MIQDKRAPANGPQQRCYSSFMRREVSDTEMMPGCLRSTRRHHSRLMRLLCVICAMMMRDASERVVARKEDCRKSAQECASARVRYRRQRAAERSWGSEIRWRKWCSVLNIRVSDERRGKSAAKSARLCCARVSGAAALRVAMRRVAARMMMVFLRHSAIYRRDAARGRLLLSRHTLL